MNNTIQKHFEKLQNGSEGIKKVLIDHAMLTPSPQLYCEWVAKHGCDFLPFLVYTKGVDFENLFQGHYSEISDFRDGFIKEIDINLPLEKLAIPWTKFAYQAMAERIKEELSQL